MKKYNRYDATCRPSEKKQKGDNWTYDLNCDDCSMIDYLDDRSLSWS